MKLPAALPRSFDGWLYDPIARGFTGTQRRWLHKYGLIDDPIGVYHVTEAGRAWLDPQRERAQRLLQGGEPFDARKPRRVLAGDVRKRYEKRWTRGRSEHDPNPWCFGRVTDAEGRVWFTNFSLLIARVPKRLPVAPAEAWTRPVEPKSVSALLRPPPHAVEVRPVWHTAAMSFEEPRFAVWLEGAKPIPAPCLDLLGEVAPGGRWWTVPGEPEGAVWYATGDGVQAVVAPLRDLETPAALAEPRDTGGAKREAEAADCSD